MTTPATIYRLLDAPLWEAARRTGAFHGSDHDQRDGFIHFSTGAQVAATAARHYAGRQELMLLWVDVAALGTALRWEESFGGELFPHLYGALPVTAVTRAEPLPLSSEGRHVFPSELA
jgi:uncharacterized protein (DUF952 family)